MSTSTSGQVDRGPTDEVSIHIDATPEQIWDMVSDVTRMGEWSPECYRCSWQQNPKEPVEGARFVGWNKAGPRRWPTRNTVVEAERGKVFAWHTIDNGNIWAYRMEPEDGGTRVTETRQLPAKRRWYSVWGIRIFFGGTKRHDARMREGMRRTLERLKAVAEGGS